MEILSKFRTGLKKTSSYLASNIIHSLKSKQISSEIINDVETSLISADIGLEVTELLVNRIKSIKIVNQSDATFVLKLLSKEITKILSEREKNIFEEYNNNPTIFLFIGVNGSGKTTTIGKLIKKIEKHKKVLVAACDTFRAAAVDQLKEWSDKGIVEWWGQQDDMNKVYSQSAIVCFPSYREGLPKSLLEAASCGLPIVAFDVPGCREIIKDGVNGFLVPFKDTDTMYSAILKLLNDSNLLFVSFLSIDKRNRGFET